MSDKFLLVICDGLGWTSTDHKNAVIHANTPNLDQFMSSFPHTTIKTGGEFVGLPKGVMGNSEVGHMNIGAGKSVRQDLVRINEAIEKDSIKELPLFQKLIEQSKTGDIHLMALLSDGGVHSHIDHLLHIIDKLAEKNITPYVHAFMDGRDTAKDSGIGYLEKLLNHGKMKLASIQGRSIGMDRDRRWKKIEAAYQCLTGAISVTEKEPLTTLKEYYQQDLYDEFIPPTLFNKEGVINSSSSLFFLNFRPDRARQISLAFNDPNFSHFDNSIRPSFYLCMTPYVDEELPEVPILFNREKIKGTLSEYLASKNIQQLKIAETEKYAHVTYFFNGGNEEPFNGEERILVPSPQDVKTYDEKPEMSAYTVLEKLIDQITNSDKSVFICNFANPDMVGHTGNYEAALKAVEVVDDCLGKLQVACKKAGVHMLITADHGNCDQMVYPDGQPHTSHSLNDVPCIFIPANKEVRLNTLERPFALQDIAPTIVHHIGIEQPSTFNGSPIFI